jgi:hypothetical protein
MHVTDDPGQAGVPLGIGFGANQEFLEIRRTGAGGPDLLACDDDVLTVGDACCSDIGQIGAGVRLRKALTPEALTAEDPRKVKLFLRLRAAGDDGWPGVCQRDAGKAVLRRTDPLALLEPDQALDAA